MANKELWCREKRKGVTLCFEPMIFYPYLSLPTMTRVSRHLRHKQLIYLGSPTSWATSASLTIRPRLSGYSIGVLFHVSHMRNHILQIENCWKVSLISIHYSPILTIRWVPASEAGKSRSSTTAQISESNYYQEYPDLLLNFLSVSQSNLKSTLLFIICAIIFFSTSMHSLGTVFELVSRLSRLHRLLTKLKVWPPWWLSQFLPIHFIWTEGYCRSMNSPNVFAWIIQLRP